jgi:uncharacterized protein (TIGR02996 family)
MSDEAALLAAIAAHPDEDTPRLMYADWLDEHGQGVRAEFIRVQIEVSHIEQLPRIELNRYVGLFRRQQELLDNHRAELLGPLARLAAGVRVEFSRGFLGEVMLSAFHFNQYRHLLAGVQPLPRITVEGPVGVVRSFLGFAVPHATADAQLELVTAIRTLPDAEEDDWPANLQYAAFDAQTWPRLDTLDVSGCHLGDSGLAMLFWSSYPALIDLDLSGNDLSDGAVESLLSTALPKQLKRLILGGNDITDVGAVALANRWPTGADDRLETLNLRFSPIGQAGHAALLRRFGGRLELF